MYQAIPCTQFTTGQIRECIYFKSVSSHPLHAIHNAAKVARPVLSKCIKPVDGIFFLVLAHAKGVVNGVDDFVEASHNKEDVARGV